MSAPTKQTSRNPTGKIHGDATSSPGFTTLPTYEHNGNVHHPLLQPPPASSSTVDPYGNPILDPYGNPVSITITYTPRVDATYEYDAFGNLLRATGPATAWNNFTFSTKYLDQETGWSYYGYRYYDALRGRWTSRDRIEEAGGANLYGMLGNLGVNAIDLLGLVTTSCPCACPGLGGLMGRAESLGEQMDEEEDAMQEAIQNMERFERIHTNAARRLGFDVVGGGLAAHALYKDLAKYSQQKADFAARLRVAASCLKYKPRIPKAPKLLTGKGKGGLAGIMLAAGAAWGDQQLYTASKGWMKEAQTSYFEHQEKLSSLQRDMEGILAEIQQCQRPDFSTTPGGILPELRL